MNWAQRLLRTLVGVISLTATVAGVPLLLVAVVGNPIESWTQLIHANGGPWATATTPVADPTAMLVLLLATVGWLLWAWYGLGVALEFTAQLGRLRLHIPGFGLPRIAASRIVAACLTIALAAPIAATTLPMPAFADPGPSTPHANPTAPATPSPNPHDHAADRNHDRRPAHTSTAEHGTANSRQHTTLTVTVKSGDNLWQLAETHYGDGQHWQRIAAANVDLLGPRGENFLEPGWELTIPEPITADPAHPGPTYTIQPGDTLTSISQNVYGDRSHWQHIYQANRATLTDPDQLASGQQLILPEHLSAAHETVRDAKQPSNTADTNPDQARSDSERQSDHNADGGDTQTHSPAEPPSNADNPAPAEPPSRTTTPTRVAPTQTGEGEATDHDRISTAAWAMPASALLAAGLLGLLATRRQARRMIRPAGRQIRPYSTDATAAVTALHEVACDLTTTHLDRATRTLSARLAEQGQPLPTVTVARLADDRLDLLLTEPAGQPPTPFHATTPTVWTLDANNSDDLLGPTEASKIASPWPALVTLGRDIDGAHLLIDLEAIGALALHAEADQISGLLAALAIELATSTWADDLTLTLVGCCPDIAAATGVDRVQYADDIHTLIDRLEHETHQAQQLLREEQHSAALQGRLDPDTADGWTPHVILLGNPLDDQTAQRLQTLLTTSPRVAIAAVTSGSHDQLTDWTLTLTMSKTHSTTGPTPTEGSDKEPAFPNATLEPLGLQLTPQTLTEPGYQAILAALRESQADNEQPASWWNPDQTDSTTEPTPATAADDTDLANAATLAPPPPAVAVEPETADQSTPTTDTPTTADLDDRVVTAIRPLLQRRRPEPAQSPTTTRSSFASPATPGDEHHDTATDENFNDDDSKATGAAPDRGSTAPIALHRPTLRLLGPVDILNAQGSLTAKRSPSELYEPISWLVLNPGATTQAFRQAMSHTSDPNAIASRARRYLGAAADGTPLFPPATRTATGHTYKLHPDMESDWNLFQTQIADGVNSAPTENLIQALRLVRGSVLQSVPPWPWADEWIETATATIVDTAHVLATRALATGQLNTARAAVRRGRLVDNLVELLIRDEIQIERSAGNHSRVERLSNQLVRNSRELGTQLAHESIALLQEIHAMNRRRASSNQ